MTLSFNTVSVDVMTSVKRAGRKPNPDVVALSDAIKTMAPTDAIEVTIGDGEKDVNVRQTILRAAKMASVTVITRRSPNGFYVGVKPSEDAVVPTSRRRRS